MLSLSWDKSTFPLEDSNIHSQTMRAVACAVMRAQNYFSGTFPIEMHRRFTGRTASPTLHAGRSGLLCRPTHAGRHQRFL